jgi:hypothetical protein
MVTISRFRHLSFAHRSDEYTSERSHKAMIVLVSIRLARPNLDVISRIVDVTFTVLHIENDAILNRVEETHKMRFLSLKSVNLCSLRRTTSCGGCILSRNLKEHSRETIGILLSTHEEPDEDYVSCALNS